LGALAMGGRGSTQRPINDSKGCGGVMRSAPVGLMPGLISDEAFDLGAGIAALTHGHVEGWTSAGAMSALVCMLTAAPSKKGHGEVGERLLLATCALQAADMAARNGGMQTAALVRHAVHAASLGALCPHDLVEQLDEGWTGDSALAIGVHAALAGVDFSDAIRIAATHSGDSDSTASIAGQLLGARDGSSIVPQEWTAVLDLGKVVERQAALFCAAFGIIADHAPRQDETASSQLHLSGWRRGETILSSALR
jgi:ADP-ribosyl-[dinitrogen reductase] hydrolase